MGEIAARNIKPRANYVLIKPDENLTTYQFNGKETQILSSTYVFEGTEQIKSDQKNYSTLGTVYAVPQKLEFHLEEITKLREGHDLYKSFGNMGTALVRPDIQKEIDRLLNLSVRFGTEVEIEAGDRVNFDYLVHDKVREEGLMVETKEGLMYLVKYDFLYMVLDSNDKPKKMLNGWNLVEPEEKETKTDGGLEYTSHESGLVLPVLKSKEKKKKRYQVGKVLLFGSRNNGYLQMPDRTDPYVDHKQAYGKKLHFDHRATQRLEYYGHQIISEKKLMLVHSKDFLYFE